MEEQVIQETPVASWSSQMAETQTPSTLMFLLTSSKFKRCNSVPVKPRKSSKALKASLTTFTKNKTSNAAKHWRIKARKIFGRKPTKPLKPKTSKLLNRAKLADLRTSNETAMKTSALSAISQSGAINAAQMLQLVQGNLKKAEDGSVKVLNGGVEEDLNVYLAKLKNPGSGYEHHFKPSTQAGMGAKPTTGTAGAAGVANPWAEGSIILTKQMTGSY